MVDGTALLMAPFFGASAIGFWSRRAGHQPARLRRPVLRRVPLRRRPRAGGRRHRAAVLRGAPRRARARPRGRCPTRTTAHAGRSCAPRSPARSPARRGPRGWTERRDATPASLPCSRCGEARRPPPHPAPRAPIVDASTACRSRRPRRGSPPRPPRCRGGPRWPGEHTDEILAEAGFSGDEVTALRASGHRRVRPPASIGLSTARRACRGPGRRPRHPPEARLAADDRRSRDGGPSSPARSRPATIASPSLPFTPTVALAALADDLVLRGAGWPPASAADCTRCSFTSCVIQWAK